MYQGLQLTCSEHKEAMMLAQSAFTGGLSESAQTDWAIVDG